MTSRFRFRPSSTSTPSVGPLALFLTCTLALAGCGDAFYGGKLSYVESPELLDKLGDRPDLKPEEREKNAKLRAEVRAQVAALFGPDPTYIKVPAGAGLPGAGIYLANYAELEPGKVKAIRNPDGVPQEGGYALYRRHCLHCHGVSGAGDGPTASFLYPRPRDYRKGLFKFTSTTSLHKPARSDLRRTIRNGLHGTSMPAFEALMNDNEIEMVIDYMTFLSMRGEAERELVEVAATEGELSKESVGDTLALIFRRWKDAEREVEDPPVARTAPTHDSVLRGRDLFLGVNKTGNKVECTTCHGNLGTGDGPSFVKQELFNAVVFGGDPSLQDERLEEELRKVEREEAKKADNPAIGKAAADKLRDLWKKGSLDDWGNPFRPANLNRGVYKGGRRPIDIYWRIAKGINGAKMPAHYPTLKPEQIWDLVNFVLALPYEPALLDGPDVPAPVVPSQAAPKPAVAQQ